MAGRRTRAEPLSRLRPAPAVAIAVVAAAAIAAFVFGSLPGEMRDFEVYWTAAARASSGDPLYRIEDGHYQFKYLPAFAVLAAPLARLPLDAAKSVWFVVSAGCLVAVIWLSIAVLPRLRRPAWLLAVIIVIAMGKFYGHELVLGQVNLLFTAIVLAGLLLLRRGSDAGAGVALVAAAVVKPYAVILFPWIAYVRGRRAAVAIIAGASIVAILPAALYGPYATLDLYRAWWMTVTESTAPNLTNADNVSLAAFFAKWLGAGGTASALTALASAALLVTAALVVSGGRRVPDRELLEASLLLTLIPLLSPQGWDYVFLVATPAVALLANADDRLPRGWRIAFWCAAATIGLSLFDIMGRRNYATFMSWSVITVCFAVLIGALAVLRRRRAA